MAEMIEPSQYPSQHKHDTSIEGHILNGSPGQIHLHKVGSAKQYATKSTGRVCNQAKFPTSRKGEVKRKKA